MGFSLISSNPVRTHQVISAALICLMHFIPTHLHLFPKNYHTDRYEVGELMVAEAQVSEKLQELHLRETCRKEV